MMDEERIRPVGDFLWLGSVLFSFSALALLVGSQEGILLVKNLCHLSPEVLFWNSWRKRIYGGPADPGSPGKQLFNSVCGMSILNVTFMF